MTRYVSPNLRRHGDSQEVTQWAFLAISAAFWAAALLQDGPVMRPQTYGPWIVTWPTQWWAGSLMLASATFLLGIIINGRWRWSPLLRLIGAAWHSTTLGIFCAGGIVAPYGENLAISSGVFCAVHLWFAAMNAADLRQAWRI